MTDRSANGDGAAEPLEDRIVEVARRAVTGAGTLPAEPTLAAELGVSRPALREALARLERDGLIRRRHGAGTIVNPGAFELEARFDQQVEFAEVLATAGYEPSMEVLERGIAPLGADDARRLGLDAGGPALRTVKRWRADGRAAMVALDIVPLADDQVDVVVATAPEVGLFELMRRVLGVAIEWELAWPGAAAAGTSVGRWLEVAPRTALMTLDLVGVARDGNRVYRAQEHLVPGIVRAGFVRTVRS